MPPLTAQAGPIGSNRPTPTPPTAQFNELDMQRTRSEEILRMISIDSPHNNLDMPESALNHHHQSSIYSHHNQQNMMGQTSTTKPPDVIPRGAPPANNSPPSSQPGRHTYKSQHRKEWLNDLHLLGLNIKASSYHAMITYKKVILNTCQNSLANRMLFLVFLVFSERNNYPSISPYCFVPPSCHQYTQR